MYGQGNLEPDDADVSESPKDLDVSLNPAFSRASESHGRGGDKRGGR